VDTAQAISKLITAVSMRPFSGLRRRKTKIPKKAIRKMSCLGISFTLSNDAVASPIMPKPFPMMLKPSSMMLKLAPMMLKHLQ
jgi:hypothetical protein